jgi:hypothetical protein
MITIRQVANENFEVYFNVIRIRGFEISKSGTGKSTITLFVENKPGPQLQTTTENVIKIRINWDYSSSWRDYFFKEDNELKAMGIPTSFDNSTLTIGGNNKNIKFYWNFTDIKISLK